MINYTLIINSALLGIGLAMDAFSVSLANGLSENKMSSGRMLGIAGTFAFFQFAMPIIGWFCVHNIAEKFEKFQEYIPWIAFALLLYIGGKMLIEGIRNLKKGTNVADTVKAVGLAELMIQGIATSIDALSVGFTIANYDALTAMISALIIGVVTLIICLAGLSIGKTFGTKLAGKASVLGGIILVIIAIKIIHF